MNGFNEGIHSYFSGSIHHSTIKTLTWIREKKKRPLCHFIFHNKVKVKVKSLSRVRLIATPGSLSGSSVHGIFQAIVLEWIAVSFSRGSSQPRDRTRVSHIVDRRFTIWATREVYFLNLTIAFNPGINKIILSMNNFGNDPHDIFKWGHFVFWHFCNRKGRTFLGLTIMFCL